MPRRVARVSSVRGKMTTSAGALPSYQRFANGVPVPLFTRRSFRPREKYLILLVFLTFGVVCFGAFFFLPDFRTGGAAVKSVYRVYQRMQKAGPELLLPVPPRASGDGKDSRSLAGGHPNAVPLGHEDSDHQDVHLVEDKQKLQVRIHALAQIDLSRIAILSNVSPETHQLLARNSFVSRYLLQSLPTHDILARIS